MNEELSRVITELTERALTGVDAFTAFSGEHLPDVLVQLLWWHGIESLLAFSLSAVFCFVTYKAGVKILKELNGGTGLIGSASDPGFVAFLASIPLAFLGIGAFIGILSSLDWLQILIAPKLYVLEYAAGLVK